MPLPDPVLVAPTPEALAAQRSERLHNVKQLIRRPTFVVSAAITIFWVIMAVAFDLFGLDPYDAAGKAFTPPSAGFWLGTDNVGRDMLARVLEGSRSTLELAPGATVIALTIGTAMGLCAGYYRGVVDDLLMRSFDVIAALPGIVAVLIVAAAFGRGTLTLILTIGFFFAPLVARTVRAAVLVETGKQYVEAARSQSESDRWILFREILPNVRPAIIVEGTTRLGYAVFTAAGLSFLGLGAQPPSADWGLAVSQNRLYIQSAWWTVTFPALAIASLVVAVNLIADNLREIYTR